MSLSIKETEWLFVWFHKIKAITCFSHYRNIGLYEDIKVIYLLESYAVYTKEIEHVVRKHFFFKNPDFQIWFANSVDLPRKYSKCKTLEKFKFFENNGIINLFLNITDNNYFKTDCDYREIF